jgi:hypothetical protein
LTIDRSTKYPTLPRYLNYDSKVLR